MTVEKGQKKVYITIETQNSSWEKKRRMGSVLKGAAGYLLISFLLMLLLTRSSFLYPYNNWDDANSYLSMGKSMFHGAVIYRDIFDQKGPYLYFLYGLCSLISRTDFSGVFIMEVIFGAIDLALIRKILLLYCSKETSLLATPILFACMCASKSFYWGGSAEELCLPFLLFPLYLLARTLEKANREGKRAVFSEKDVFLAGLCCGVVFNIKFTLMGFYLAFAIIVIASCCSGREFARLALCYILGILLPFVPWVIYFGVNGALDDWFGVYIYTNVFVYSDFGENSHGETMGTRLYDLAKLLYWLILDNIQYFIFILIGMIWMFFRKSRVLSRLAPVLLFSLTFFFIYIGGATLPYYAIPLTTLSVYGMAAVGTGVDAIVKRRRTSRPIQRKWSKKKKTGFMGILLIASLFVSLIIYFHFSWNIEYLSYDQKDVFLSYFTEDIQHDQEEGIVDAENTTLLNIGCLDCGLYTTADIYPSCYWFQTQTLPGDEVTNEQIRYIEEEQIDYVVARDSYPQALEEHYEQIDSFHQVMGTQEFDYYLFRKKQ